MIAAGVLRDHSPDEVAGIVGNLRPCRRGARLWAPLRHAGRADQCRPAEGSDIWFLAIVDDEGVADRLRGRPVAISIEMVGVGVPWPQPDKRSQTFPASWLGPPVGYHGRPGPGWTMTAVAVMREGEPPGHPGSAMFAVVP